MWGQWTLEMNHVTGHPSADSTRSRKTSDRMAALQRRAQARQQRRLEIPGRQSVPDSDLGVEAGNPAAH